MKRFLPAILAISAALSPLPRAAGQSAEPGNGSSPPETVYVIPVHGMIESGLLVYVVRRGISQAMEMHAGTIVFDMDTPGGMVNVAEEIIRLLIDLPPNVKTYTYVNKDALSAGAFIALATDEIYMAPGGRIGAAAIISPGQDIPEGDMKEKVFSATLALVKRAATSKGHDVNLVDAMARREFEYKIGEEVICAKGALLTLTDLDAGRLVGEGEDKRPLLSSGVVRSVDELLEKAGKSGSRVERLEIGSVDKIARWIKAFQALFLMGALLGFYIEFKTPGFGLPGISGILCLVIFFWAQHVAGLAGAEEMLLLLLGMALLLIEILVLPGFGAAGVAGIACIAASAMMAMVQHYPGTPWHAIPANQMLNALFTISGAVVGSMVLAFLLARYLPQTSLFNQIALPAALTAARGFSSSGGSPAIEGARGVSLTQLHPGGAAEIAGKRVQVVSEGDFIDKDTPIVVVEARGSRIVVRRS